MNTSSELDVIGIIILEYLVNRFPFAQLAIKNASSNHNLREFSASENRLFGNSDLMCSFGCSGIVNYPTDAPSTTYLRILWPKVWRKFGNLANNRLRHNFEHLLGTCTVRLMPYHQHAACYFRCIGATTNRVPFGQPRLRSYTVPYIHFKESVCIHSLFAIASSLFLLIGNQVKYFTTVITVNEHILSFIQSFLY